MGPACHVELAHAYARLPEVDRCIPRPRWEGNEEPPGTRPSAKLTDQAEHACCRMCSGVRTAGGCRTTSTAPAWRALCAAISASGRGITSSSTSVRCPVCHLPLPPLLGAASRTLLTLYAVCCVLCVVGRRLPGLRDTKDHTRVCCSQTRSSFKLQAVHSAGCRARSRPGACRQGVCVERAVNVIGCAAARLRASTCIHGMHAGSLQGQPNEPLYSCNHRTRTHRTAATGLHAA